jgi:alkyldihydroxyacetonephosphate synthase
MVGDKHVTDRAAAVSAIGVGRDEAEGAFLVRPGSAAEIAELVSLANRHRIPVIPVGNGARAPKAVPQPGMLRLFVDIRRMNHVLDLDETSLVVHAQAGLTALALEKILAPRMLTLGDYPPAALGSTLGGLLAVRTPGKSSRRHGFIEDAVLGVSAVLADGRTVHTRVAPRRSTGPDLARALCGSEGALGIITSAVLRIHRRPETRYLAAHALPGFAEALQAVRLALREEAAPAAMRIYDCAEARVHLGVDVCSEGESVLVVATAGPTDLAACDRDLLGSAAEAVGGRALDKEVAQTWWQRRMGHLTEPAVPLPTFQVSATPSKQLATYRAVVAAAAELGATARAHASRFDADGAVMFFTLCGPDKLEPLSGDAAETARTTCQAAAAEAGAFLLGSHAASLDSYLATLRAELDPHGIMNPGALRF